MNNVHSRKKITLLAALALTCCEPAFATPVYDCPTGGTLPLYLPPTCPAPRSGMLYPVDHPDIDAAAANQLVADAAQLDKLAARLEEREADVPAMAWALAGVLLGGLAVYVFERER